MNFIQRKDDLFIEIITFVHHFIHLNQHQNLFEKTLFIFHSFHKRISFKIS
jgi:hypothetical protein